MDINLSEEELAFLQEEQEPQYSIKNIQGEKILILNISQNYSISVLDDLLIKEKPNTLSITDDIWSQKESDFSFLKDLRNLNCVNKLALLVQASSSFNADSLSYLKNLTELCISDFCYNIDFNISKFPHLTSLIVNGNVNIKEMKKNKLKELLFFKTDKFPWDSFGESIERLSLRECKNYTLSTFKSLTNLKKLDIVRNSFTSLSDLAYFQHLDEIDIAYCSKLKDISGIENCKDLATVDFEATKKIADYTPLTKLKKLRNLRIFNCGDIPSLSFINDIPSLEDLNFTSTNIVDGDLKPCLRLKSAWSSFGKKHYNIKVEDLPH